MFLVILGSHILFIHRDLLEFATVLLIIQICGLCFEHKNVFGSPFRSGESSSAVLSASEEYFDNVMADIDYGKTF